MPNPTMHPFEKVPDGYWCDAPDGDGKTCARREDHPIHSVHRADVDRLARALLARQWRTYSDFPELAASTEHRRHVYSSDCAICVGDVHTIAVVVLDILQRTTGPAGLDPPGRV